ncbi:MAG: mechanosensitive ion channel protein MscS [Flammeovirgaceae bacterium]|nr:mechanosensitive ion channel protein MscS [Flammeovirgaceae bacterium]MBR09515.1 mechanosensitive ion channel protein MscS [Rickettsiales bacterium]HCX24398.1 mechanosensitive ion channel protein MscS [Cytophagales bacterium]
MDLPFPAMNLILGLLIGVAIVWIARISIAITAKKSKSSDLLIIRNKCKTAFNILIPVISIFISLSYAEESDWTDGLIDIFRVLLIMSSVNFLIRLVYALEAIFLDKYNIDKEDNRKERKIITQLNFMKRVVIVSLVMLGLAVILLSFEEGRKYGQTLLTSAGVASIIIGLAAQKSIANFFAGIQIAFTQPIKIDDAVVVEGEWGWIEEINLTYVVVRIWDWRRLILPITYFIEKPFQNWTRNKGEIIGTVFLHLDYRTPIEPLRAKLSEILKAETKWDGNVDNLQVVDTKEYTVVVRALMSAKNSPTAWDLRCSVREKLINFLQKEYPESLPVQRIQMDHQETK